MSGQFTVAPEVYASALTFVIGMIIAFNSFVWIKRHRDRLDRRRDTLLDAYRQLRDACFPETLNPDAQGNPEAIKAYAVEFVNLKLSPLLKKRDRIDRCTREDSSLLSWFEHVEKLGMKK